MKYNFLVPTLSTTISGVILAAVSFFVFYRGPVDLTKDISIRYVTQSISQDALKDLIEARNPSGKNAKTEHKSDDINKLSFGDIYLSSYAIKNKGVYDVSNLKADINDSIRSYIFSDSDTKVVDGGVKEITLRVQPNKEITLMTISTSSPLFSTDRFIIDGKQVPVLELSGTFTADEMDDYLPYIQHYGIFIFILSAIGVFSVFIILSATIFSAISSGSPKLYMSQTSDDLLVKCLTVLNMLREENFVRYSQIVTSSEKLYKKWVQKSAGE
jgi:hypothetical protein